MAYGENEDDVFQLRPGAAAVREFRVLAPLRIACLTKAEIRLFVAIAVADLSSRIPHGTVVTSDALATIGQAEVYVRSRGFSIFRVRYVVHPVINWSQSFQIAPDDMKKLSFLEKEIQEALSKIGFRDLIVASAGYKALGSL